MGFGGGSGMAAEQLQVEQALQQDQAEINAQNQAAAQQAEQQQIQQAQMQSEEQMQAQMQQAQQNEQNAANAQAQANAAAIAKINAQYQQATGQTKAAQAASQLGIMDYIATSPTGLANQSGKLGSLQLLGNG